MALPPKTLGFIIHKPSSTPDRLYVKGKVAYYSILLLSYIPLDLFSRERFIAGFFFFSVSFKVIYGHFPPSKESQAKPNANTVLDTFVSSMTIRI